MKKKISISFDSKKFYDRNCDNQSISGYDSESN